MKKNYEWLEAMRGFAAIWVVLHHADLSTKAFQGDIGSVFFSRGFMGVDFFFILSGFIIAHSTSRMMEGNRGFTEYAQARFLRIFLPYLPIGISLYFLYVIFPSISAADRDIGFLTSFTLFPTSESPALSVAWTLKHELLFYAFFGSMFISKAMGSMVMLSWLIFITGSLFIDGNYGAPILNVAAHPLNLWFFVGILVFKSPKITFSTPTWSFVSLALCAMLYFFTIFEFSRIYVGIILASLIYLMTSVNAFKIRPAKSILLLGSASYSIYLIHNPIQSIIARIPRALDVQLSTPSFFALLVIGGTAAGIVYFYLIEARAIRWAKLLFKNSSQSR